MVLSDEEIRDTLVPAVIGIVLQFYLLIIFCRKLYFDLHGAKIGDDDVRQKAMRYRKKLPKATPVYVRKQLLIAVSILFYALYWVFIAALTVESNVTTWYWLSSFDSVFFCIAKTSQYSVFMMRLHNVYNKTPFAYAMWKKNCVVFVGFLGVFPYIVVWTYHTLSGDHSIHKPTDDGPVIDIPVFYAIPFVLSELLVNVAQFLMFGIPLWKTKRAFEKMNEDSPENLRNLYKLTFVGSKFFVIAGTASMTTLLAFVCYIVFNNFYLVTLNTVSDAVCMILISPYFSGRAPWDKVRKEPAQENHWWYFCVCRPSIYICYFCGGNLSLKYLKEKRAREEDVGAVREERLPDSAKATSWDTHNAPQHYADVVAKDESPKHHESMELTPAPPDVSSKQPEILDVASDSEIQVADSANTTTAD